VANTTFSISGTLIKHGGKRCPGAAEKQLRGGWPRLSRVHTATYKTTDRHTNEHTNKHKHKTNVKEGGPGRPVQFFFFPTKIRT
jgi:hypothetical protein